jgi:general secretion pathway protein I
MRQCNGPIAWRVPLSGFTLIEVMVALGIVAIALLAATKASNGLTLNTERLGHVMLAQLCAENEMIKARLAKQMPPVGDTEATCLQAGRTFKEKLVVRPTPNPNFRRLDVQVFDDAGPILTLSTVIGKV